MFPASSSHGSHLFLCGKTAYLPTYLAKENPGKTSFEVNLAQHSTAIHLFRSSSTVWIDHVLERFLHWRDGNQRRLPHLHRSWGPELDGILILMVSLVLPINYIKFQQFVMFLDDLLSQPARNPWYVLRYWLHWMVNEQFHLVNFQQSNAVE